MLTQLGLKEASGVRGLLRNHKEEVILAFTKRFPTPPLAEHTETLGIIESLCLAYHFSYLNVHLECDCKGAGLYSL